MPVVTCTRQTCRHRHRDALVHTWTHALSETRQQLVMHRASAPVHVPIQVCSRERRHDHTEVLVQTNVYTHVHTHINERRHTCTHMHNLTRTHTYTHVHTRTHTYTHVHTRTHPYAPVRTCSHTNTHAEVLPLHWRLPFRVLPCPRSAHAVSVPPESRRRSSCHAEDVRNESRRIPRPKTEKKLCSAHLCFTVDWQHTACKERHSAHSDSESGLQRIHGFGLTRIHADTQCRTWNSADTDF